MLRLKLTLSIAVTLLLTANTAFAGGLYLPEIGTPISVGTAGVGNVTNTFSADAAITNPAGMTDIEHDVALMGMQLVIPTVRFDSDNATTAGGSDGGNAGFVSVIPSTFVVKTLGDDWRLGLGITAPLGGGVDYGKDFVGRYQAQRSVLTGLGIAPSVAYRVNDKLSFGGGVSLIYTNLDLDIAINQPGEADAQVNIDKIDDWGYQGFVSVMYKATDRLTLGAIYRNESDVELEGDIGFKNVSNALIDQVLSNADDVEVDFSYPQAIDIGMRYELNDSIMLMADFNWQEWSAFGDTRVGIEGIGGDSKVTTFDRDWDDTWHVGFAIAHKLSEKGIITGGIAYDSSPVSDSKRTADIPVDEQLRLSAAYGKTVSEKFDFALGTTFLWLGKGKMDQVAGGERFKGEFSTNNIIFLSATMNYKF